MLKPSHFTTPRTLRECNFDENADPIERPDNDGRLGSVVWAACLIVAAVATIIVAVGAV